MKEWRLRCLQQLQRPLSGQVGEPPAWGANLPAQHQGLCLRCEHSGLTRARERRGQVGAGAGRLGVSLDLLGV